MKSFIDYSISSSIIWIRSTGIGFNAGWQNKGLDQGGGVLSPNTETTAVASQPARAVVRILFRHVRLIGATAFLCGVLAVGLSYLIQPQFQAQVTILPHFGTQDPSLMAAFGNLMNVPVQGAATIEVVYPAILKSNALLDRIIEADKSIFGPETSLFDILRVRQTGTDSTTAARELKMTLREQVLSFDIDHASGLMTLRVMLPGEPHLAAALANSLADSLADFVETFSLSKTRHRLQYVQRRVGQVGAELENAEEVLAAFREENRVVNNSPQLTKVSGQKDRHVQALKGVWIELIRQLEIAKIDDDRERYSVDILDRALPPLRKSSPLRANMGIMTSILAAMFMSVFVIMRDFLRPASKE